MLKSLGKPVALQILAMISGVALAALLWGADGAVSALCGGLAIVLPSLWFAWRLSRVRNSHVSAFFIGQFVKIAGMIGILALVWRLLPGAHWGAVVTGMAVTLQANFFALLTRP